MKSDRLTGVVYALLVLVGIGVGVNAATAQPSEQGAWTDVINWPIQAIHTAMLPTGKVMLWQTWTGSVGLWDPVTQQFSQPPEPEINVFCAGHAWLPDGRLLVVGGHIANNVGESAANIYDPFTNSWADDVAPMNAGRWYPSATTLGNGEVLVMSGDKSFAGDNNRLPQIYNGETNTWRDLTSARKSLPLYPRTFLAPDGSVVSAAGHGNDTDLLDPTGTGSWSYLGDTLDSGLSNYGSAVMYKPGEVAYFGGGNTPTANVSLIDLNDADPTWSYAADTMAQPRRQNDATILADGTVLVSGGSSVTGWNDPAGQIARAEIWDPETGLVEQVAAASDVYRGYHSTATLLPDARVLITGGNHEHNEKPVSNRNAEIYSPPYLFNGPRPTIASIPEMVELGRSVFIETPDADGIDDITLIVPGATTHSQNWTQRATHLEFTVVAGGLEVELPANPNEAPLGYHMLFLISDQGVPSVAEFVRTVLPSPLSADFDADGDVDGDDFLTWQTNFGTASGGTRATGDSDGDGDVDGEDFLAWQSQFTPGGEARGRTASLPEPACGMLLLLLVTSAGRRPLRI